MQRRSHPNPQASVPLSLQLWHQLLHASGNTGYQKEDWEIAAEAIDEWLRRHAPEDLPTRLSSGYQWKRLFLPTGTLLRTVFDGKNHHSMVEGDQILYQGTPVSPSGFVNAVGGMRRNAWRCTWIRFPHSDEWKLADTLRTRERQRRARRPAATTRPASAPPPRAADRRVDAPASMPACAPSDAQVGDPAEPAVSLATNDVSEVNEMIAAIETITANPLGPPSLKHAADSSSHQAGAAEDKITRRAPQHDTSTTLPGSRSGSQSPADSESTSTSPSHSVFQAASQNRPHATRGPDRRMGPDSTMAAQLLQQLLPLLHRLSSLRAPPPAARP